MRLALLMAMLLSSTSLGGGYTPPGNFSPLDLSPIGWYTPRDLSTLFEDSSGTTQVSADNDVVGLVLDKSQGLALGTEKYLGLQTGTWDAPVATTITGEHTYTTTTTTGPIKTGLLTVGKSYKITYDITTTAANGVRFQNQDVAGAGTIIHQVANGGGTGTFYLHATVQGLFLRSSVAVSSDVTINSLTIKEIAGNHSTQGTTAAKALYKTSAGLHWLRFDGVDDRLITTIGPTAAMTLAARFNAGAGASIDKIIGGGDSAGNRRCYISIHSDGSFSGGVGAQGSGVIKGSSDVRSTTGVGIMTYDGTTVKLYWQGAEIYSAAQSGTPAGSNGVLNIGAWNNGGGPADFFVGDIYDALVLDRAITAQEAADLTDYWNA